ncbi:MAG: EF-hand domain-containing protein [Lysobacter sp.]|nr:MAG: EF-hand domain-containing protein [Lysobacter sp.]
MKITGQPTATIVAAALLVICYPVCSAGLQAQERSAPPMTPTTCAELAAVRDRVDHSNRHVGMLKQRCDLEDIRAKFAEMDRNNDGHLKQSELPAGHMLSEDFGNVDINDDQWLSLAEVAEYDAEIAAVE